MKLLKKNKIILVLILFFILALSLGIYFCRGYFFKSGKKEIEINAEKNVKDEINNSRKVTPKKITENTEQITLKKKEIKKTHSENNSELKNNLKTNNPNFLIKNRLVNWGFTKTNGRKIDTIIVHSSYNALGGDVHSVSDIINKEYKPAGVSPHYIISRRGTIYRLVQDKNIAYHAGVSKMPDGRTNVNNFSLGIEIVETKSESPSDAQYLALKKLLNYLKGKYKIKYVLGHSDIAPGRKTDPWNFDWKKIK